MADNDDYMVAKTTGNEISELMWDRLQEGINANRRYRLKAVVGGSNMIYDTTKIVWSSDIYIFFTRESDGAWVYNKINANPTTGITCNDNDVLYVTLNDTSTTVLTISSADYTVMPTDDTGRILIFGAVVSSTWYGNILGGVDVTQVEAIITAELVDGQSIDNAIDSLITTHTSNGSAHHVRYADSEVEAVITAELVNGQSIDNAIDSLIATHAGIAEHPGLDALDDRDFKPNTSTTFGTVRVYFTSLGGMTGVADSDYQDLIIFDSYVDASGGDVNALTFDKSEKLIKHWLADQADGTWGTPEIIAYVSDITTHESDTSTHGVSEVADAADLHSQSHDNTDHTTNYEVANANIQSHVGGTPPTSAHHVKTTLFTDLTDDIVYTQLDSIVDTSGTGGSALISRADHVHTDVDGSSKVTYSNLSGIPSTFTPVSHNNTYHSTNYLANLIDDQTPQLYANLDVNKTGIDLTATALTASGQYSGITITGINYTASTMNFGDFVQVSDVSTTALRFVLAHASTDLGNPCIGMVVTTANPSSSVKILILGVAWYSGWSWTATGGKNNILYCSTTSGDLTETAPSGSGQVAQAVAFALGEEIILINPSYTTVESV